jgi:tRNA-2-methylthio-N6-dimethylallyladenosine synthase
VEITLLGQTINHYAFAHGDGRVTTFADLLHAVHEAVPSLPRLRFVTSFPRDFDDHALAAMRDCPRICRYLHAPAQHGSDRILRLMNRGYTAGQYREFVGRARAMMPDVAIASDFIVGFPTETEDEFEQTRVLLRECRFKNSFIFKYSPRPGTVAFDRHADDVDEPAKRRRNALLLADQQQVSSDLNEAMVGQVVQVLVEGRSKLASRPASAGPAVELGWEKRTAPQTAPQAPPQLLGRTRGDQVVCFDGDESMVGTIQDVGITAAGSLTLFGRLAESTTAPLVIQRRGTRVPAAASELQR